MREVVPLQALDPRWLVDMPAHRWGVGLDILCPTHGSHRIRVMFSNPVDGGLPVVGFGSLFHRVGETFADLTVLRDSGHPEAPLTVRGHWVGRVLSGQLHTERLDSDDVTRRTPVPAG